MKKVFLAVAGILGFSLIAQGQLSIIPKVGITVATMAIHEENFVPEISNIKPITGIIFGMGIDLPIFQSKIFSVQSELLYLRKGMIIESSEIGLNFPTVSMGTPLVKVTVVANVWRAQLKRALFYSTKCSDLF